MSKTFCIYPWLHLEVTSQGFFMPCCIFEGALADGDVPLSAHTHTMEQVWNSRAMRDIRRAMSLGKGVPGCKECYRQEAAGNLSYRQRLNQNWETGLYGANPTTVEQIKAVSAADDYVVPRGPLSFQLDTGSRCNLKCRMCCSFSSTRIERDAVHSGWADQWGPPETRAEPWYKNKEFIQDQLLRRPDHLGQLYFVGGEPFLVKEIGDILEALIRAGVADRVGIGLQTNGTTVKPPWLKLLAYFRQANISVSLDGFGDYYEYIRYPAHWDDVARNLDALRQMPQVDLMVGVTLQAYNLLNVVELLRYLDAAGVERFTLNTLHHPSYLCVRAMPAPALQLAVRRLRAYADDGCRAGNRDEVLGVVAGLEVDGGAPDADELRQFMLFTNDLDVTRGQSFRRTHAELLGLLEEAGFPWTDETLHAGRTPLQLL